MLNNNDSRVMTSPTPDHQHDEAEHHREPASGSDRSQRSNIALILRGSSALGPRISTQATLITRPNRNDRFIAELLSFTISRAP
jgi:hypothetical protein